MRVVVATDAYVAVAFDVPVAEFLTARDLERHDELRALGPDLLDEASTPARRTPPPGAAGRSRLPTCSSISG